MMDLAGLVVPVTGQFESGDFDFDPSEKMARAQNLGLGQECLTLCVDRLKILLLTGQVVLQMAARGCSQPRKLIRGFTKNEKRAMLVNYHSAWIGFYQFG